jgi:hypothetical protein
MPKSSSRKRGEGQRRASEKGKALPSYAKEIARELLSGSSRKVARRAGSASRSR